MRILPLIFALALAGCSLIPGTTASLEREARAKLATTLTDAESARFQGLVSFTRRGDKPERIICGQVNGKNRLGAYAGFHRFALSRDTAFAVVSPDEGPNAGQDTVNYQAGFDEVWKDCTAHGAR